MKSQTGFTLIEIMVVVVILGILSALAVPRIIERITDARIQAAKSDIGTIEAAISFYKLDNSTYPPPEFGLRALVERPPQNIAPNWKDGGYLKKLPTDPWGNDYLYSQDGNVIDIYTLGSDGQPGGERGASDIYWSTL